MIEDAERQQRARKMNKQKGWRERQKWYQEKLKAKKEDSEGNEQKKGMVPVFVQEGKASISSITLDNMAQTSWPEYKEQRTEGWKEWEMWRCTTS